MPKALTTGKMAALTRKRKTAAKKAATTRKRNDTTKLRAAKIAQVLSLRRNAKGGIRVYLLRGAVTVTPAHHPHLHKSLGEIIDLSS